MIKKIIKIAKDAGKILVKYFNENLEVNYKTDNTPVTKADSDSDKFLRQQLKKLFPKDQILTEETPTKVDFSKRVWIVDPLDGTKAFVERLDGFCIIIGLCINGTPELGVVNFPLRDETYYAEKNKGAFVEKKGKISHLGVSEKQGKAFFTSSSDGHPNAQKIISLFDIKTITEGSFGARVISVASGNADFYIELTGRAHKWDTCGTQIILEEAGGKMTDLTGNKLDYKTPNARWENYTIISSDKQHKQIIEKIKKLK